MDEQFQHWLGEELERGLSARTGRVRPTSAQLTSILGSSGRGRGRLPGGLTLKAAGVAVAAVILTATGALAAGTAATGSPNPAVWGQQVSDHVTACRNALQSGQHGLGECVSDFAQKHGAAERAQHSQAGQHGQSGSHTPGPPASVPVGHDSHPAATPATKPTPGSRSKKP
jgi:hypothetical protein